MKSLSHNIRCVWALQNREEIFDHWSFTFWELQKSCLNSFWSSKSLQSKQKYSFTASESTPPYLEDFSTLETELIISSSFEIVFGDGLHAGTGLGCRWVSTTEPERIQTTVGRWMCFSESLLLSRSFTTFTSHTACRAVPADQKSRGDQSWVFVTAFVRTLLNKWFSNMRILNYIWRNVKWKKENKTWFIMLKTSTIKNL